MFRALFLRPLAFAKSFIISSFLFLFPLQLLHAHTEHQEIQVKSTFHVNQQQQLSSLTMVWLYDTISSQDMLSHEKDINRLAKVLVSDLARFSFFTRLNSGDRRLIANRINKYKVMKVTDKENNPALQLTVTLLFNKPIATKSIQNIQIDHSDPTGISLLFYDNAKDIVLTNELKSRCKPKVIEREEFQEGEFPQLVSINCGG